MRVLVISPGFHGYASSFARTLTTLGHDARAHAYDDVAFNPLDRWGIRSFHRDPTSLLSLRAQRRLSAGAVDALVGYRPDAVLIVRGDLLDDRWWDALDRSGARRVTWMYDELQRMRYSRSTLGRIGVIASYSPLDTAALRADGLDAHHVPLGFDALEPVHVHPVEGVSLIGARYPSRQQTLRKLRAAGVKVTAFGRDWSRHPIDVLRTGSYENPGIPTERALRRGEAYGAMRGSLATLNLHGDQDGFTMRTFEASGVGGLQLCDRADVVTHYDVGKEVLTFADDSELVERCRRIERDSRWADAIRMEGRKRTLAEHTLAHRLRDLEALWA